MRPEPSVSRLCWLYFILMLVGCKETPAPAAETHKTAPSACRSETFEDVPLTHCVADPARHTIRTELDAPDGDPARSLAVLQDMAEDPKSVAFAVNGGMFDDEGRPIGYYVEDGERLKTLNRNRAAATSTSCPTGCSTAPAGAGR